MLGRFLAVGGEGLGEGGGGGGGVDLGGVVDFWEGVRIVVWRFGVGIGGWMGGLTLGD